MFLNVKLIFSKVEAFEAGVFVVFFLREWFSKVSPECLLYTHSALMKTYHDMVANGIVSGILHLAVRTIFHVAMKLYTV